MKYLVLSLLFLTSCMPEKKAAITTADSAPVQNSMTTNKDDFSDLEKKTDGGCTTEEDLEKKIMEKTKKGPAKAFKLQGGDPGCSTSE